MEGKDGRINKPLTQIPPTKTPHKLCPLLPPLRNPKRRKKTCSTKSQNNHWGQSPWNLFSKNLSSFTTNFNNPTVGLLNAYIWTKNRVSFDKLTFNTPVTQMLSLAKSLVYSKACKHLKVLQNLNIVNRENLSYNESWTVVHPNEN